MPHDGQYWEEQTEAIFHTDLPEHLGWRFHSRIFAVGALIGLLCWLFVDRNLSWSHILIWAMAGAVAFCVICLLPAFKKSLLKEIRLTPHRLTVVYACETKEYAWSDLEAALFQSYPVVNLGTSVHYFRFRTNGKNIGIMLDGLDDEPRFSAMAGNYLRMHHIPVGGPKLPTFERELSRAAAWVFILSACAMLIAHLLSYHTLGTVFGLGFMLTGTCMALMTRKERLSRWVLAATALLLVSSAVMIRAFDLNVPEVLNSWEMKERRLGLAPWGASKASLAVDKKVEPEGRAR